MGGIGIPPGPMGGIGMPGIMPGIMPPACGMGAIMRALMALAICLASCRSNADRDMVRCDGQGEREAVTRTDPGGSELERQMTSKRNQRPGRASDRPNVAAAQPSTLASFAGKIG